MVGRVPLIQLFLAGNSTSTTPHMYSKHRDPGFPMGCTDAAEEKGRGCEVNHTLVPFIAGSVLPLFSLFDCQTYISVRTSRYLYIWILDRHNIGILPDIGLPDIG
jgi:hypothetical protein